MKKLFKLNNVIFFLLILVMTMDVKAFMPDSESPKLNFCFYKTGDGFLYLRDSFTLSARQPNNSIKGTFLNAEDFAEDELEGKQIIADEDEDGYLTGAKFTFKSVDNKTSFDIYENKDDYPAGGMYCAKNDSLTQEQIKNMMPSDVIKKIDKIKAIDDFNKIFNNPIYNGMCGESASSGCNLTIPIPFILDEIKAPNGYLPTKKVIGVPIRVYFGNPASAIRGNETYSNGNNFDIEYDILDRYIISDYDKDYDFNYYMQDIYDRKLNTYTCNSTNKHRRHDENNIVPNNIKLERYYSEYIDDCYIEDNSPLLKLTKQDTDGKKLEGAKFTLHDLNNKVSYETHYENPYYMINGPTSDDEIEELLKNLIPSYDSPKNLNDLRKIKNDDELSGIRVEQDRNEFDIMFKTYFILDETKAPIGYTSKKYLIPLVINAEYYLNNNKIVNKYFDINVYSEELYPYTDENMNLLKQYFSVYKEYKNDMSDDDLNKYYDELDKVINQLETRNESTCKPKKIVDEERIDEERIDEERIDVPNIIVQKRESNNQDNIKMLDVTEVRPIMLHHSTCAPAITDEKGKAEFKIDNKVNDKYEYEGIQKESLSYKVIVRNIGNAAAGNNIVTTHLPDGLVYEVGSASDGGIYDDKTRTITWRLDYISPGDTHEFTYKATIPDGVNATEFVGNSTISGEGMDEVKSGDTVVTIIENPKTGISTHAIMIGIISMLGVGILAYMKKINLIKKI